jgi:hypothetical protein
VAGEHQQTEKQAALGIATVAAIRRRIVTFLICTLSFSAKILLPPASQ